MINNRMNDSQPVTLYMTSDLLSLRPLHVLDVTAKQTKRQNAEIKNIYPEKYTVNILFAENN